MARWIVFDENTATQLRLRLPHHAIFEAPGRSAFEYALTTPRTVIAMLEQSGDESTIAVFRPGPRYAAPRPKEAAPVFTSPIASGVATSSPAAPLPAGRASGFLGLSDNVVLDEEEAVVEKKWWQWWR